MVVSDLLCKLYAELVDQTNYSLGNCNRIILNEACRANVGLNFALVVTFEKIGWDPTKYKLQQKL
jgi:hypothetical protein